MQIDFSKMKVCNIEGEEIKEQYKALAMEIYVSAKDLSLIDIALKMNRGEPVELTLEQLEKIKELVNNSTAFYAFFKKAILDFIAEQK